MKRIAIIAMGVKLGFEQKGYTRHRTLANMLVEHGYHVDLITSSFQHWDKQQRDVRSFRKAPDELYGVVFLREGGYTKNVAIRRISSHASAARNLSRYLEDHPDYDLVIAGMPPNDLAATAARFAVKRGIPFICDVFDLWPETMRLALDVRGLSDVLFSGFARDAREAYRAADAVIGTCEEYAARPFEDRPLDIERLVVYPGTDLAYFDEGVARYAPRLSKPDGEFWVTYAGTFGTRNDLKTLIDAVALLNSRGYEDINLKMLGSGPFEDKLRGYALRHSNIKVCFDGHLPYQRMAAFLRCSDVLVNSLAAKAPQAITNKIGDYLASGHPLVSTAVSTELCEKIESNGVGINVTPGDAEALADAIASLHDDPSLCQEMGIKARLLAEQEFDRSRSYRSIVSLVDSLIADEG